MPDGASPAQTVLEALGYVVFERTKNGLFQSLGDLPQWLTALWPALQKGDRHLPLKEASPFLENFLVDAEECWRGGGQQPARSGPWVERGAAGAAIEMEATALTTNDRAFLILERLGQAFAARKEILQRARESVIANQRLNSEIQKKEILLHCVADEMSAALANVITSLRLIELENNSPRTKTLLALATRATQEQQTLIHRILGIFEGELRGLYNSAAEMSVAACQESLREAIESLRPLFAEKHVSLEDNAATSLPRVNGDRNQLARVFSSLLENALERSGTGDTVRIGTEENAKTLLVSIDDQGTLITEPRQNLLQNWTSATEIASPSVLRLHFCRIALNNCEGEIGYDPLPGGGNRFWARLTKSDA